MAAGNTLWAPYVPDDRAPWNLRRVVHLHHRAGFAGTWAELQRDLKDGPRISVDRFLAGQVSAHTPALLDALTELLAQGAVTAGDIARLKAWWFYRMLFGPDPLGERLALFWHSHFASGYSKVQNVRAMWRQNEIFRKFGRGPFADLLHAVVRDPALLIYLDAPANRKGHPNENLARELMELFTLGVGHYTEADVQSAARALTGWTVEDGQFIEVPARHDTGDKTLLGKRGTWTGTDLAQMLLDHPATSQRLATKLCDLFFGEEALPADAVRALTAGLREHQLDIGWAVETVLRSRLFFADANLGNRVLGPVEFVAGVGRTLELFDPAPSTLVLADWSARIGQNLFDPPNVGGWPGGRNWVSTRSMIVRANFITALLDRPGAVRSKPYDPPELARRHGFGTDAESVWSFHYRLRFGTEPTPDFRERLSGLDGRKAVVALLSSPEAQLG